MEILIGADPELFLRHNGVNVSGHGLIPGSKRHPHPVPGGAVQVDGTALEFNIEPASNEEEFITNIQCVLEQLRQMIPQEYQFDMSAVAAYEAEYFRELPAVVKEMGCDPDFDAYSGIEIEHKAGNQPFRTAAGHIHIGWTNDEDPFSAAHYQSCRTLAKELDIWLGLPSVLFDPESAPRRQLYGRAGSFRPKPYGLEYRVMGNWWIDNEKATRLVYRTAYKGFMDLAVKGQNHYNGFGTKAKSIIDEGSRYNAKTYLNHHNYEWAL